MVAVAKKKPKPLRGLAGKIAELTLVVHRLEQTVRCRLEAPANLLTLEQAEKRCGRTLDKANRARVFTDCRGGKTQGSKRMYYADEIDVFKIDGAAGVKRLRNQLGRD